MQAGGISEDALRRYDALIATAPAVVRRGKTMPYTSMNGHMFSFLQPDGTLALRLPDPEREAFVERYGATQVEQHGRTMREYVSVPHDLFARTHELAPLFARAVEHVGSLRPKKTTR